jgi:hypothetical protein
MTARPTIVTPAYATAITEATIDLADRVRTLTGKTAGDDSGRDLAAALASDFITALCRRVGGRPTPRRLLERLDELADLEALMRERGTLARSHARAQPG